jgi:hypothetical protein
LKKHLLNATLLLTSLAIILSAASFKHRNQPLEALVSTLVKQLKVYTEEYPQEKVHLHLDKPYYAAGETIWYAAYLVAGSYHQPSPISKTLYVELLSPAGTIVKESTLRVEEGVANGAFELPNMLEEGVYTLRSYTRWMQNFNQAYFFTQHINIWNPERLDATLDTAPAHPDEELLLHFFPEGGNLVAGLPNRVAFKAECKGATQEVEGKILDESGATVSTFTSVHKGMGAFMLAPKPNARYFATLTGKAGNTLRVELPAAQPEGIALFADNASKETIKVKLLRAASTSPENGFVLIAQSRGVVQFSAKGEFTHNAAIIHIPKAQLPDGIVQITVFDQNAMPRAERLVFINNQQQLTFTVRPDKESYAPREEVKLHINALTPKGEPAATRFSVAVVDAGQVLKPDAGPSTLLTSLLLQSDLQGEVEDPTFYFGQHPTAATALDNLMMTQGWRRFTWQDLLQEKYPAIDHLIEQGFIISGTVTHMHNKKPVKGGKVTLMVKEKLPQLYMSEISPNGKFAFPDLIITDTAGIMVQAETGKGNRLVSIDLDKRDRVAPHHSPMLKYLPERSKETEHIVKTTRERFAIDRAFALQENTLLLKEVVVRAKTPEQEAEEMRAMYGYARKILKVDEIPGMEANMDIIQALQGRVTGLRVTQLDLSFGGTSTGTSSRGAPVLILVDHMPVDVNIARTISPKDVKYVDIFRDANEVLPFGPQGANGVIAIYLKRGAGAIRPADGVLAYQLAGYTGSREFYSPQYKTKEPEHIKPDKRATLYWNPQGNTNSQGEAALSFYNSDTKTPVRVIIEGISPDGRIGYSEFTYTVK